MKHPLTNPAVRTVLDYCEDIPGVSSEESDIFIRVSLDILQEPIDGYLAENSPYRGMAHTKEYSEPIMSGQVYCGEC